MKVTIMVIYWVGCRVVTVRLYTCFKVSPSLESSTVLTLLSMQWRRHGRRFARVA
jgi:hypothetical protein